MTATARTGIASSGCAAAPLLDCDGKPPNREHYFTKAIIEAIASKSATGSKLMVGGLSWLKGTARESVESELVARVWCPRHNEGLSPVDAAMSDYFTALTRAQERTRHEVTLDGELLERWALKSVIGTLASGNAARRHTGERHREAPSIEHLELLFGHSTMPDGWGMYVMTEVVLDGPAQAVQVFPLHRGPDHPTPERLYGITIGVLGLFFTVVVGPVEWDEPDLVIHRPGGVVLNDAVAITFRWNGVEGTGRWLRFATSIGGAP